MKIALVYPPSTILTKLEAQGHKTEFFDMSLHKELPEDGKYDQLWISANSPQMYEVRRIAEKTKDWVSTKTVIGGAAPWANPETSLDLGFDLVVIGEGDHPDDLEWVLPPVRRWSLDYHAYMDGHRMASLFTSRGCPMSCAFCESGRHGVIWNSLTRYEPMWCVEAQIKEIYEMGFTGLAYYDDIFIVNRKRTYDLLALHKKWRMVFRCFLRSDILCKHGGRDYLKDMKDAGLIEVFVGVESADNQIKGNIHKGTTVEQDEAVLEWCRELGIRCKMSFILGLPGESMESMQKTRQWILKNKPDIVQVDRLVPFKGTPLVDNIDDYDLKYEDVREEEWFFRGRFDINSRSFVSTSHLSINEIDDFWHKLEMELLELKLSSQYH
jgi:radical SAM superfamily enzyme YgiQ (UPF0313 family)